MKRWLKMIECAVLLGILVCVSSAEAQQTAIHSVPVGKGPGQSGFNSVGPCGASQTLQWPGSSSDPICAPGGIAHGGIFLSNDGTATGVGLIAYNGNGVLTYCTTTSAWKLHQIPPYVAITGAADNGSGLIRITHAVSAIPYQTNQGITIQSVGGVPNASGSWYVTVIDSTHVDLQGSTFAGAYTSGGTVVGAVSARVDSITIDAVAAQAVAADTVYHVGVQFFDSACTVGKLVLTTTSYGVDATWGFNSLNGYTNTPLVGVLIKYGGTIQGGANSELVVSWYNRGEVDLKQEASGATSAPATWTKLSGTLDFLIWADDMPHVEAWCSVQGTVGLNNIYFGLSFQNTATVPDLVQQTLDISGGVGVVIPVPLTFPATPAGFIRVTGWLKTDAGTVTANTPNNCTMRAHVKF